MNLLPALGYAVFERVGEGSFELSGPAPDWLPAGPFEDTFPFLEVFLLDAEEFWAREDGRPALYSDMWAQNELHFGAIALAGERKFLLIENAEQRFQQTQKFVQYAHEVSLARDRIAKLSIQLEHATRAKSEFLAHMSHEIRTPMNAILGIAELLSETELTEEQREYVSVFRSAGDNLLNIINDILDFSKVEAGEVELEQIQFDLAEVLQQTLEIAAVKARAKGLDISTRIQPGVPARLIGDAGRLRQILLNLLGNATKFTERGRLSVLVDLDPDRQEAGSLHFSVSDTGIGIPADRLSAIFESFSQADASTTRKYGGTGLGLAISKRFVELMGGNIWAESTLGLGTTMHFTARFSVEGPPAGAERPAPKPLIDANTAPRNRSLRILLADDSEHNRFLIREYLKDSGCVLDEVENGALALENFKQRTYDVVLMDTEMPVLDGYSTTRQMRALERERAFGPTPIFALTAHALPEAKGRSFEAGCTGHLTKPIKKATLLETLYAFAPLAPANDRIEVSVEEWLKPVVGGYLEKCRADVATIRLALDRGDYDKIRMLGHQLAGTGGGYGFQPITDLGYALEESALASDAARMRVSLEDLDRYLSSVQVA
jgi:signal transduction histidine kinase/CheY-like chemotaxis protein/HPt (histidine-containing phosphotransfer) domain-containing protein